MILYHGSSTKLKIGDKLIPRVSFDGEPYVYLTDFFPYALLRSGNFSDPSDVAIYENNNVNKKEITLVELRENAFDDKFSRIGYIYKVNVKSFTCLRPWEYVSKEPVEILDVMELANIYQTMTAPRFRKHFRFYDIHKRDKFFREKNICYKDYLDRRSKRLKKLEEAL